MNNTRPILIDKRIDLVFLTVCIFFCASAFILFQEFYHDDAFITLRYIRNFLDGYGIVWNPGERVEGYSNFFFLLLTSFIGSFGVGLMEASRAVNMFSMIALFLVMHRIGGLIPAAATITFFPLILWTLGGLESPLFALLCTIGVWRGYQSLINDKDSIRNGLFAGTFLALASLTRPDGIIFAGLTIFFFIIRGGRKVFRRILSFIITFMPIFGGHILWRYSYYGTFVPNTYYVKATNLSIGWIWNGFLYVIRYATEPPFLLLGVIAVLIYANYKKKLDFPKIYLITLIGIYLTYVIYVGGDHMIGYRFLVPIIPLCVLFIVEVLRNTLLLNGIHRARILTVFVALTMLQLPFVHRRAYIRDPAAFLGHFVANYINQVWPEGALVALNTAGSTPFFASKFHFIDMLGLNDPHIARREIKHRRLPWQWVPGHTKGDGAYVLSREPDYIIIGPAEGINVRRPLDHVPYFLSDLEISEDPRFKENYVKEHVQFDVRKIKNYQHYAATYTGVLNFIYYRRKL